MRKKRVLFIGDGVASTGFSTVMHGILNNVPSKFLDVHHLAINYHGDPHDNWWKIYPAQLANSDYLGMNRIKTQFSTIDWDGIFILNDVWVIANYLKLIKNTFKNIPPIVTYFPVDAKDLDKTWFDDFDIVNHVGVYTNFALNEVLQVYDAENISVIPHGLDHNIFKKLPVPKNDIRRAIFPKDIDAKDAFIILSAHRNQPRKRIDITIEGFNKFAKDKDNVFLYLHCGSKDVGVDIFKLTERLGCDNKLIVTSTTRMIQNIPAERLNIIYNACDVGINTSTGEGWSLTNMEHAVTGAPQVVPNHSVMPEIFGDCSVLIPINQELRNHDQLTLASLVKPDDVANSLQNLYDNKDLYNQLSLTALEKFSSKKFSWETITKESWLPIFEKVYEF